MIESKIVNITPELAREWLARNTPKNRKLRPSTVRDYKGRFQRGEYIITHQGIAFDETGMLIDGQHRLRAIAELDGVVIPMLVTRGLPANAYQAIDTGLKRSLADSMGEHDRRLAEVARLIVWLTISRDRAVTAQTALALTEFVRPAHDALMAHCSASVKTWSAATVRSAAVLLMTEGEEWDYVGRIYRALLQANFDAMPPIAHAMYRGLQNGTVQPKNQLDMVARCIKVFDHKLANLTKIQITTTQPVVARMRAAFAALLPDSLNDEAAA